MEQTYSLPRTYFDHFNINKTKLRRLRENITNIPVKLSITVTKYLILIMSKELRLFLSSAYWRLHAQIGQLPRVDI